VTVCNLFRVRSAASTPRAFYFSITLVISGPTRGCLEFEWVRFHPGRTPRGSELSMETKDYSGSIVASGSKRTIEVSGNSLGRTAIRLASPAEAAKPKLTEVRLGGLLAIGIGMMSLVVNYYDLKTGHYWTSLGVEPMMIMAGVAAILFPGKLRDLKGSRNLELVLLAGGLVLCYVSHDLLLNWLSPR
jgi:hypothetical protein